MKIYVNILSAETTENELRHAFEAYGKVETADLVKFNNTRSSYGFAFVNMPDEAEAHQAMKAVNSSKTIGLAMAAHEIGTKT